MGGEQQLHAFLAQAGAGFAVVESDDVALVTHHTAHLHAFLAGEVGEATGIVRHAAAAGQADIHVDYDLLHTGSGGGLDRRLGIDRQRDTRVDLRQATGVDNFVRQQLVLTQPRLGHPLDFANRRAGERPVSDLRLTVRQRGALVRLDVRPHARSRERRGHRLQVVLEPVRINHERRRT